MPECPSSRRITAEAVQVVAMVVAVLVVVVDVAEAVAVVVITSLLPPLRRTIMRTLTTEPNLKIRM